MTPDPTPGEQQKSKALRVQLAEMNNDEKNYWIKNDKICAESELNVTLCTHMLGNSCQDSDIKCMLTSTRSSINKFVELPCREIS